MAKSKFAGKVQTVLGLVDPKDLRITFYSGHNIQTTTCRHDAHTQFQLRDYRGENINNSLSIRCVAIY